MERILQLVLDDNGEVDEAKATKLHRDLIHLYQSLTKNMWRVPEWRAFVSDWLRGIKAEENAL